MATEYSAVSPGTYISELDLTTRVQVAISTTGCAVFASKRGTLDPFFASNVETEEGMYGRPDPAISFAHDCNRAFLSKSSQLWNLRVVNGALHAGLTYFKDDTSRIAIASGKRLLARGFSIGKLNGYKAGARAFTVLTISRSIASGQTFVMSMTDGATSTAIDPVAYATDNNTTVQAIAASIQTALSTYASDGQAIVVNESSDGSIDNCVIIILAPTTVSLSYSGAGFTGSGTLPTATLDTEARIMEVFAENPGVWANDVGVKITNVDRGIRQRWRLTIGGPFVSGNRPSVTINGDTVGGNALVTNSDAQLAAFAALIAAHADVESATVETVAGALNNDRSIVVVAKNPGPGALDITGFVVTGSNAPTTLAIETLRGVASTNEFDLEVYSRSNVVIPEERYRVTLAKQVNNFGQQTAVDYVYNDLVKSLNIRVIVPDTARSYVMNPSLIGSVYSIDANIRFMLGGDDGATPLNAHIRDGWDRFKNREKIGVRILMNTGYVDPSVAQKMVGLAETRHDSIAVLDMPSAAQSVQAAYTHRMEVMNLDSSFGALYTPDLQIPDDRSDELRYIPPSGHVSAQYAFNDAVSAIFYAPAGLNRGKLSNIRGLRYDYDQGDRDLLDPVGVNCIIDKPGAGPTIWGEETTQIRKSILSEVHSRRLLNALLTAYADGLDYVALFEPNNTFSRFNARQAGEGILAPVKRAGGLYDYAVVCDERNNKPDSIQRNIMRVDVYLQITPTSKIILLRAVLTPVGANFAETIRFVQGDAPITATG